MDCPDITTLEQAEAKLPSSVLPIDGLRRDENDILTRDSLNTIVDGLKSRGINILDEAQVTTIAKDLKGLFCTVSKQYFFLLNHIADVAQSGKPVSEALTDMDLAKNKNIFMIDIMTVTRHLEDISQKKGGTFIEGWQNTPGSNTPDTSALAQQLAQGRSALEQHSFEELRRHMVHVTAEKNKVASNNLGFYGFLNIVAVGLIIYAAAMNK